MVSTARCRLKRCRQRLSGQWCFFRRPGQRYISQCGRLPGSKANWAWTHSKCKVERREADSIGLHRWERSELVNPVDPAPRVGGRVRRRPIRNHSASASRLPGAPLATRGDQQIFRLDRPNCADARNPASSAGRLQTRAPDCLKGFLDSHDCLAGHVSGFES